MARETIYFVQSFNAGKCKTRRVIFGFHRFRVLIFAYTEQAG
jgi:hypothetical protein